MSARAASGSPQLARGLKERERMRTASRPGLSRRGAGSGAGVAYPQKWVERKYFRASGDLGRGVVSFVETTGWRFFDGVGMDGYFAQ